MPGYPDFRRQRDWDSFPALVATNAVARTGTQTHGPFYVGLWHGVGGQLDIAGNPVNVTLEWYDSEGLTEFIGSQHFIVDSAQGAVVQWRYVNLGPWLIVRIAPSGAVAWTESLNLWATNRTFPTEVPTREVQLLTVGAANIAGGASRNDWLQSHYAGPALWHIETDTQPGRFRIQSQNPIGTWNLVASRSIAAATNEVHLIVIPPGAVRSVVTNQGGVAGDFNYGITPSLSGG